MPKRRSDSDTGTLVQIPLVNTAAFAVGTFRVTGTQPGPGSTQPYTILSGAPAGRADVVEAGGRFAHFIIDISSVGAAGTLTVSIFGFDIASHASSSPFYLLLASAALAAVATTVLRIGPALTAAANLTANDFCPLALGIQFVVGGNSVTFSLGANFQV